MKNLDLCQGKVDTSRKLFLIKRLFFTVSKGIAGRIAKVTNIHCHEFVKYEMRHKKTKQIALISVGFNEKLFFNHIWCGSAKWSQTCSSFVVGKNLKNN